MIHELRIYHCLPNRLPALLNRFNTVTLKLWDKYGIRQAGFWTTLVGPSNHALYYLWNGKAWPSARTSGTASPWTRNGWPPAPRPRPTGRSSSGWRTCSCSRPPSPR